MRRGFVPARARFVPARAGFVTLRLLCIEKIKTVDMLRPASRIVVLPQSRVLEERIAVVRCLLNSVRESAALFAVAIAFLFVETASFAANNNSVTYDITQGAGGSAVVNWTVVGGLNTSGVGFYPANNNGNGFNGFIIDASGIFNGSNFTNSGLATATDGSQFSANNGVGLSSTSSVTSFIAIHSGTSDRFGLTMSSAFPSSSDVNYSYALNFLSGTGSFVLPISYSAFNVGTYTQFQPSILDGGPYAGTFNTTVNVLALPEPSTWVMGLVGIACAGWAAVRCRKQA